MGRTRAQSDAGHDLDVVSEMSGTRTKLRWTLLLCVVEEDVGYVADAGHEWLEEVGRLNEAVVGSLWVCVTNTFRKKIYDV